VTGTNNKRATGVALVRKRPRVPLWGWICRAVTGLTLSAFSPGGSSVLAILLLPTKQRLLTPRLIVSLIEQRAAPFYYS
jgi:hypothetical protein